MQGASAWRLRHERKEYALSTLTQLARPQWQAFFDRLSPLLRAHVVEVEVTGLGLDERIAAEWARLGELNYQAGDDLLEVCVHGGDREIHHPAQIHVRQDDGWLQSIEIVDGAGHRDFIVLREPLRLTA